MNTLIPLEYYTVIYYYFLLGIVFFAYIQSARLQIDESSNIAVKNTVGNILMVLIVLYMGSRPVSGKYFGDMRTYSDTFLGYASGRGVFFETEKDIWFNAFMEASSKVMSVEMFFMLCTLLYVIPLYIASKRFFNEYWFYGFLILVTSFSFWSYGTNGIRNGIATSLFLLGISLDKKTLTYLLLIVAALVHKSMLIPIGAFIVASNYKNTKVYLLLWLAAIPLSLVLGSFWEGFFLNLGLFEDQRLESYFIGDDEFDEQFSSTGFRWDFLAYSFTGVFAGWYFIMKREFEDKLYLNLYHMYLLANAFWVLVIRVNFSNRFAYLSWFMLGIVIIYPMLKFRFFEKHHFVIGRVLLAYFLFSFIMAVILG